MAATSGTFNLAKITKVEYADADLVAGVVPSVFTSFGTIEDGKFNMDFPEPSVTADYSEQTQQVWNVRFGNVMNTATLVLPESLMTAVALFTGGTLTAGTAGTTPDVLELAPSGTVANKYIKVTGLNTMGKAFIVSIKNAMVTWSWSGAMGANQAVVGLTLKFYMLQDAATPQKFCSISSAF